MMLSIKNCFTMALLSSAVILTGCNKSDATAGSAEIGSYTASGHSNTFRVNGDVVGGTTVRKARVGETMHRMAASYDVGVQEIIDANPDLDRKQIKMGQKVVIPKQYILPPKQYRNGIVINIAEMRMYYFTPDGRHVTTYPVALGREGWRTPLGTTQVVRKKIKPSWKVPASIRKYMKTQGVDLPAVVPPGPDNPLGDYAVYLGFQGYLIHGTNAPASIGQSVSSGCIRMFNRDVKELFAQVRPGTPVHIIHYPTKVGWVNNKLYVESHTPFSDPTGNYASKTISARQALSEATAGRPVKINEKRLSNALSSHRGIPVAVGESS